MEIKNLNDFNRSYRLIGHYLFVQKLLEFSFVRESVTHYKSQQCEEFKSSVRYNYTGQKPNFRPGTEL